MCQGVAFAPEDPLDAVGEVGLPAGAPSSSSRWLGSSAPQLLLGMRSTSSMDMGMVVASIVCEPADTHFGRSVAPRIVQATVV